MLVGLAGRHRGGGAARPAHVGRPAACQDADRPDGARGLPHHADLLHQRASRTSATPTRRSGRHDGALPPAARAPTSSSSRAPTSTATRSPRRPPRPARSRRPSPTGTSKAFRDEWEAPRDHLRPVHPHDRAATTRRSCRRSSSSSTTRRDLLRQVRRPILLRVRALLHREGDRRRQVPRPPDPADLHRGGELLLPDVGVPGLAPGLPGSASGVRPAGALPERGARDPAGAAAGPVDQPAEERGSSGASRSRSTTASSPTSGSTRSSTTSRRSASRAPTRFGATGPTSST